VYIRIRGEGLRENCRYDPNESADEQVGQSWMVQRQWDTIDPVFSVDDKHLACNIPATPPPSHIPIAAGDEITAVYWFWLHPVGPMTVWLARCGDTVDACQDVDVNHIGWFKIWEAGLLEGPNLAEGVWYQKKFQKWDGSPALWPVTIPSNIRAGGYIIRHEILSIHIENKPQFYPQCAHLSVNGTGTAQPPEEFLYKFPGGYAADGEFTYLWISDVGLAMACIGQGGYVNGRGGGGGSFDGVGGR
jgi:hypothetical protein